MKKFTFRFQTLLDTKQHFEEMRKNELGALLGNLHEEHSRLKKMKKRLAESTKEYTCKGRAAIEEIRKYRDYFDKLNNDIAGQTKVMNEAAEKVEDKRRELISVQKEKLALEKLKQKDYSSYLAELKMWENKFLDEIGSQSHARAARDNIQ